ncbi:hypothetical protein [Nocardioides montaniterrae]
MTKDDHLITLTDLIELRRPIAEAVSGVAALDWDSDQEVAVLSLVDLKRVMEAFQRAELAADEVEAWAEALHGRDDVGFEAAHADLLAQALFELSTPELFGGLPEVVERLRHTSG